MTRSSEEFLEEFRDLAADLVKRLAQSLRAYPKGADLKAAEASLQKDFGIGGPSLLNFFINHSKEINVAQKRDEMDGAGFNETAKTIEVLWKAQRMAPIDSQYLEPAGKGQHRHIHPPALVTWVAIQTAAPITLSAPPLAPSKPERGTPRLVGGRDVDPE